MTSNGDLVLLDTSAALALVDPTHQFHGAVLDAVSGHSLGLSGHAAHELFSVLTRLPFPARLSAPDAARLIATNFPGTKHLSAPASARLTEELAELGVVGGAVFDALVAACARQHGVKLITCDQRAQSTYSTLKVAYLLVTD